MKVKLIYVVNYVVIMCKSDVGYFSSMKYVEEIELWSDLIVKHRNCILYSGEGPTIIVLRKKTPYRQ